MFPTYDGNGNVTRVYSTNFVQTNQTEQVAEYRYGPFGEHRGQSGRMASKMPFRWSTKFADNETGLSYYGYRYYSASIGRWISRDPIGERDHPNRFCFVRNQASSRVDPIGLMTYSFRFVSEPDPIIRRPVPPLNTRTRIEDGIEYIRNGTWHSSWNFSAYSWPDIAGGNMKCCQLQISGSLKDRWYWAIEAAVAEELRELAIEERWWRDFAVGVNAWKWATADDKHVPCDLTEPAAEMLNAASEYSKNAAQAEWNELDLRDHPNPGYQRSYDSAIEKRNAAKAVYDKAKTQVDRIIEEYRTKKRTNPCNCKAA
ncbi:MAG: RHS repeat-associated core domain-containing protein [Phycisphaerales bacterium]|nr:RHS repeat-associated core domain-containing protein [Phycisphaerales bacterium]